MPHSARVAIWSRTTCRAAFTMLSATSTRNPACQESRNITHALLRAAVAMRFVTAGCKPEKQERRTKFTNLCAASTLRTRPYKSGASPRPLAFYFCKCFYVKWSSCYSLVHILLTSSSKSAPNASVPNDFYVQIELSLQRSKHFADLIFQKTSVPVTF